MPGAGRLVKVIPGRRREVGSLRGEIMRQEREQIMRKKGVSSEQKTEAGRAKGVGHLFLQKDGELAGRPQQPPAYCGQLIVSKERAMDSPPAAGLIMSTLPQLEPPS